ncbi:HNH endonuclease family protein [Helicobacter sp. WB40]|uniref:HNH endonuclease family protein n=1 Tax=Helicobacter sp. WB40 TaxID=3004130 RepID=UPI0022EBE7B3|nr:HNH endonuclease family protein [Helicobacter sp. WB40]MDA3967100.1 HNH endonuclease family protein [Helicobacter sp. WB40]
MSSTDIIKNALFDKIIKITNENKAMEYYQDYWNNVFDKDEATQEFWNKEVETGRIKRSRSEILLHSYATINGIFKSEHSLSHLSSLYKEHIKNLDENKLKQILKELKDYSEIYRDFPDINKETTFKYEKYELRFFHIISVYNINTILPLVLFLKNLLNQKKSIYKECLYLLEALIVCNILCNVSSKDYNKFFPQIIEKIKGKQDNDVIDSIKEAICEKYKDKESFDKDKIKSKLKCIKNNKKATLILFWIELYKREQKKDYKDDTSSLEYNYTLEHLLPQSWETHWSDIIQDEEEAKEFIYQIGNMTLLKSKLNSTLQNNSWNNKLIRIDGKVNTDLLINKELEDKLWTKTEIEKRTSKFIDDFFKIWNVDLFEI